MIYYYEYNENYDKYIRHSLGEEEVENNKAFTIDGSGDSNKIVVYCDKELALAPNTIVFSIDENDITSNYWWVVQEDKATLIDTNIYRHDIQLIGAIQWFKFKFAYTGTFYYHRYSYFEVMIKLLYSLWKPRGFTFYLNNFSSILDGKKLNQKFSFKGYTVLSCLNEIEKALNVEFKFNFVADDYYETNEEDEKIFKYNYLSYGYFDIIDKNPKTKETYNIDLLDEKYQISQFPNRSYASRVVGRVSNATSGATCTYPKVGYAKLNANNDLTLKKENACIILPYNIDRIDNLQFKLIYSDTTSGIETGDYVSLYETYENKDKPLEVKIGASITKIRLKEKTLYDFITDTNERDHTLWYERGKNIIHNFEPYLSGYHVYPLSKNENVDTPNIAIDFGFNKNVVKVIFSSILEETLITSNTQVNCDDVIYNQTGSNADLVLTKDFVNSYATSISTGTLTRIKYHNKESECFKVGSVFIKDNERYVVSSVSIDKYKDKVKAEYKLSKDYVAKTELISADCSIESYAIPQNNIVKRIQEYKTLIRFRDTPSLKQESYTEARYFTDFTSSERNDFVLEIKGTSKNGNTYFVGLNPITIETAKTSILMYDMRDNNYAGFVVNETGNAVKSYYQYALNYVDSEGELKSIEMKLKYAGKFNILPYMSNYPYLTKEDFESNRFLSSITNENNYLKDGYETPVFLFTREYQDHYGFVFGDNVSLENGGSLKLYLSANLINNNLFSTNNLEFINDLQISSLQTHDNGYKYFEISFTRKDEIEIPSFSALGKNLVVFNRNGMVFAKNNCKQFETNYDEKNLTRTYIWRIYLETYKI